MGGVSGYFRRAVIRGSWALPEEVVVSRIHSVVQLLSSLYTAKVN